MKQEELIEKIFTNKLFFEKEILDIQSENDRSEVMRILSTEMVENILKENINFLYIEKLEYFTLTPVINILFKELANEWISYAMDVLEFSKEDALEELQADERVKFIHILAVDYNRFYKDYLFEAIANSFIDLLSSMNQGSEKIKFVNSIINSDLIANRNILNINSFDQLYQRVKSAKNFKNIDLSSVQIKISEILQEIEDPQTEYEKRESLFIVLPSYERKEEQIKEKRLEEYDASLQRVKRAIFNALKSGLYKA